MELKTRKGVSFWIDDEDLDRVGSKIWHINSDGYLCTRNNGTKIRIHRYVIDVPNGMEVDHIDRNPLNNRKENLRICTHRDNICNVSTYGRAGFLGVYIKMGWKRKDGTQEQIMAGGYGAKICYNYKPIHLGVYHTAEDAAIAYDKAALKYHGDFANLNFHDGQDKYMYESLGINFIHLFF